MRGIVVFLVALVGLAVHYLVGAFAIEPLLGLTRGVNLAGMGGQSRVQTIRDIYFIYAPMTYIAMVFAWSIRYYLSPNRFVGRVR